MKPSTHSRSSPRRRRGFTLFEVMAATGVFLVLTAGVFGILQATTGLMDKIAQRQARELQKRALIDYFRRGFLTLPAGTGLAYGASEGRAGEGTSLRVLGKAGGFDILPGGGEDQVLVLEARPVAGGALALVLWEEASDGGRSTALRDDAQPADSQNPVPMLDGLTQLDWAFYDKKVNSWKDTLNRGTRPALVEMTLGFGSGEPERYVFWIPPLAANNPPRQLRPPEERAAPPTPLRTPALPNR